MRIYDDFSAVFPSPPPDALAPPPPEDPPRMSIKDTTSSLFPTAIVLPSGDQEMLMFSPSVSILATADLGDLMSQRQTSLSVLQDASFSA